MLLVTVAELWRLRSLTARGRRPELPALPVIALETFPSDARTAIEAALAKARRAPRDAAAAGELGITLQAWEQWEAAHLAYQRAHVLAPASADWRYLDGMVLQRLVRPAEAAVAFQKALNADTRAAAGASADGRSAVRRR